MWPNFTLKFNATLNFPSLKLSKIIKLTKIKMKIKTKKQESSKHQTQIHIKRTPISFTYSQTFSPNTSIATKHTQPTFKAQISNCTTSQSCPFNTTDMPHQPKTTQTLKRTHTYYSFISRLSSKDRTFLFTPHDGPHQHHHITTQLTIINHTGITK